MSKHAQPRRNSRRLARTASLATAMALFVSVLTSLASPAQAATTTARSLLGQVTVTAETWSAAYNRDLFRHRPGAGTCGRARQGGGAVARVAGGLEEVGPVACQTSDAEAWWPERKEVDGLPARMAVAACHQCPASGACLDYALAADERFGIWGGTTPDERRALRWNCGR